MMTTVHARKKKRQPYRFVATCGAGLENLVMEEILSFAATDVTTSPGAVSWQAMNLESAYRACLWSRFSSRILLQITQFEAPDPETLYEQAFRVDWSKYFSGTTTFAVYTTLVKSELSHSHYASLKVKDAVVDQFRKRTGKRPNVDVHVPGIRINLHVEGTMATLALDLSGDSLHRRGYRSGAGEAPLKETLAAAIAYLTGIRPGMDPDLTILDPMCGSGTLLIEAALILGDSAPGLLRDNYGFLHWYGHNANLWEKLQAEALAREDRLADANSKWPQIIGYDADPLLVATARKNIVNAGLKDRIVVKQRQLARLQPPSGKGILLTNPPYGERLSEKEAVKYLYRCLGRIFKNSFNGWRIGFFTANPDLADMLGLTWQDRFRLYNGPIKCRLLTATSPGGEEPAPHVWQLQEDSGESVAEDFKNRLRKNCRLLLPWAVQNHITCFRIYDADMPEYNLAIDLYEQWVHVQEYAPAPKVDTVKAKARFDQALQVIRQLLAVPHSQLFIKSRQKQRGKSQYQKRSDQGKLHEVHEGGGRFLVNFTDYLDTGLFLDHRKTRSLIAELAQGKTFLNLFGYTGSATVYAAMGGATSTMTVDLSEKYLSRAQANLSLNGYGGSLHRFVQADCLQWLKSSRDRFGVIFIDPPTFSNARHQKLVFDIQKDHVQLLHLAMGKLSRDGVLIFSNNARTFQMAPELAKAYTVEEITDQTIPGDFTRKGRIHRCWRFTHADSIPSVSAPGPQPTTSTADT